MTPNNKQASNAECNLYQPLLAALLHEQKVVNKTISMMLHLIVSLQEHTPRNIRLCTNSP